jgi:ubiquinone/menaquinone biosynthesis C-methylase UbiE
MRIGDLMSKYIIEFSDNLPENISLIDIGCGKGDYTILLNIKKKRVLFGLDNCNRLEMSLRKEIKFVRGDAMCICFSDATFDATVSLDVIEHVKDDEKFLSEFFRILKCGGDFLIGTPNRNRLGNTLKRLLGKPIKYPYYLGSDEYGPCVHMREYDENSLREMLSRFAKSFKIIPLGIGLAGKVFCKIPQLLKKYCSYYLIIGRK